ncbi:MAG TPA: hypothetical protein VFS30_00620 [Dehalococcoidia bacterium]|nr:hypothetical protein [Dehalococcoidia bacterium]
MSWEQYAAIKEEARDLEEQDKQQENAACPLCGELLDNRDGILNCPLGHYRTTEGATTQGT